ncbi:MAG TPA: hypothetical protein VFH31_05000, partial [Pyrinomonadaceae bacterium]|nr:hypothetical protein [Pyrinomonadaceae bacterium]
MGLFWRRKSKDQFVTLGLNEPRTVESQPATTSAPAPENVAPESPPTSPAARQPEIEPQVTGGGPTPEPIEPPVSARPPQPPIITRVREQSSATTPEPQKPVPTRSPFAMSVLGLNLTIEELQAQEAALEREFSARFRRAVAATRESRSERLDSVFQG